MSMNDDLPVDDVSGVEERPQNRREWGGPLRSLVLPVLIVAVIVGAVWYAQRRGGGSHPADGLGVVELPAALNTTGRGVSTNPGRAAPDFVLASLDGSRVRLSDLRGRPVLVNFWASWCAPCREEMPEIVRAYGAHAGALTVLAVDLQENTEQVRQFASEFGMTFPIVTDTTGAVADAWRIGGPIQGIPSSYFVDAKGIVQAREYGPMTAETIARDLALVGVQ
jgi:cytochrome c biogenesis protein CcmG/thiol:disulfide interchange protein DsbE